MVDRSTDSQTCRRMRRTEAPDVAALQAENASLQDRLLRALADTENVRRRADRAAQDARNFAVTDLSRELLTVVDNLRRAIEAVEDQSDRCRGQGVTARRHSGHRAFADDDARTFRNTQDQGS